MGLPKQLKSRSFRVSLAPWPPAAFSCFQVWAIFTPVTNISCFY